MKYRPIYLPNEIESSNAPIFNTEKEARDWLDEQISKCPIKVGDGKLCEACLAEWDIDEINNH